MHFFYPVMSLTSYQFIKFQNVPFLLLLPSPAFMLQPFGCVAIIQFHIFIMKWKNVCFFYGLLWLIYKFIRFEINKKILLSLSILIVWGFRLLMGALAHLDSPVSQYWCRRCWSRRPVCHARSSCTCTCTGTGPPPPPSKTPHRTRCQRWQCPWNTRTKIQWDTLSSVKRGRRLQH